MPDLTPLERVLARATTGDGPVLAHLALVPDAVRTGFPTLDRMLGGGLRRGDLVVLAGDVASGKSALALAVALRAATADHITAYLSAEGTPERVLERAVAIESRVSLDTLRGGRLEPEQRAAVGAAALRLRERAPAVELLPAGGVPAVADVLRRHLDLELAVVDSLGALAVPGLALPDAHALAVRQLKALALELQVAILVTAPLAAAARGRPDPRPTLEDLGALGALAGEGDVVLGLFREEMYQADRGIEGATELRVLKNRHGPTGYVDLYFYKQWVRFEDMVD